MTSADDLLPTSSYRLQMNDQLTFSEAGQLTHYLRDLGISHCYLSPIWSSKRNQGYAIVDHSQFNSEMGGEEQFLLFHQKLRENGLKLICDIVPNHMYIVNSGNRYWFDILENGQASKFADYFDIEWTPPRKMLANKVLLPLLERPYNESLERQEIKAVYDGQSFKIDLKDVSLLPTDPKSYQLILKPVIKKLEKRLEASDADLIELKSIATALSHLPSTSSVSKEKVEERDREKEIIKFRLQKLILNNPLISEQLHSYLITLNGKKGKSNSFNLLENFLRHQPYHLCFWRMANEEINYRRFFDFFELAGIRTENHEVFAATHRLIFDLIDKNLIDGIRIDHIDGLWNPTCYLQDLVAQSTQIHRGIPLYIVVEKILIGNEKLNEEWPVNGTVGYDFLNILNGLFVNQNSKKAIESVYQNFTGASTDIPDHLFQCKRYILETSLSSELSVLSRYLIKLSEHHRSSQDYTHDGLKGALKDVIACFPVYRSYIIPNQKKIGNDDLYCIQTAIARAKRKNPTFISSIFDFIKTILLLDHPPDLTAAQISEREDFVFRFQQLTGPVMAKGVEDTFFYRYFPLPSLNEVGNLPKSFGISIDEFHRTMVDRCTNYPHSMLATSTHDTKRSEDVRARINVLSEIPDLWQKTINHWAKLNLSNKSQNDEETVPNGNEEYLLYATLVGSWPLQSMSEDEYQQYRQRILEYIQKSIKEAKVYTSWINPNSQYEKEMEAFVERILDPKSPFIADFKTFVKKIAIAGALNSLSQTLIKLTAPGVPDIYQGNELWDFSLVDPDNRRPVDFSKRREFLSTLQDESAHELIDQLMSNFEDGRIKFYTTLKALQVRKADRELFSKGSYLPLTVTGPKQNNVIAFARANHHKVIIVAVSRFFTDLISDTAPNTIIPSETWRDTRIQLPLQFKNYTFTNRLTHLNIGIQRDDQLHYFEGSEVFSKQSIALIEGIQG